MDGFVYLSSSCVAIASCHYHSPIPSHHQTQLLIGWLKVNKIREGCKKSQLIRNWAKKDKDAYLPEYFSWLSVIVSL